MISGGCRFFIFSASEFRLYFLLNSSVRGEVSSIFDEARATFIVEAVIHGLSCRGNVYAAIPWSRIKLSSG